MMEDHAITVLPVVGDNGKPVGMIHLHDLVQLGILHREPDKSGKKTAAAKPAKKRPGKPKKKPSGKTKKR